MKNIQEEVLPRGKSTQEVVKIGNCSQNYEP